MRVIVVAIWYHHFYRISQNTQSMHGFCYCHSPFSRSYIHTKLVFLCQKQNRYEYVCSCCECDHTIRLYTYCAHTGVAAATGFSMMMLGTRVVLHFPWSVHIQAQFDTVNNFCTKMTICLFSLKCYVQGYTTCAVPLICSSTTK